MVSAPDSGSSVSGSSINGYRRHNAGGYPAIDYHPI